MFSLIGDTLSPLVTLLHAPMSAPLSAPIFCTKCQHHIVCTNVNTNCNVWCNRIVIHVNTFGDRLASGDSIRCTNSQRQVDVGEFFLVIGDTSESSKVSANEQIVHSGERFGTGWDSWWSYHFPTSLEISDFPPTRKCQIFFRQI